MSTKNKGTLVTQLYYDTKEYKFATTKDSSFFILQILSMSVSNVYDLCLPGIVGSNNNKTAWNQKMVKWMLYS